MTPLIGITTYPPNDRERYDLPHAYVASVRRAGADVVMVPPGPLDVGALASRLDGIVLAGGGDVDPERYGGVSHDTVYGVNDERDESELALTRALLLEDIPTLAVCRGCQVVNVALGGSLHVHLPDVVGDRVLHRLEPEIKRGIPSPVPHPVEVESDSLIAKTMEATTIEPLSWHHQGIARVGDGLRIVGRAHDGTVEAIEHEGHSWLACVQWHPELTADRDSTQQRLFDGLVAAAGGRR